MTNAKIHPTAVIDPRAKLAPGVVVGAFVTIQGEVTIGVDTEIRAGARLFGPLTFGARNIVHSNAVIGDFPQDKKFKGEHSETILGDDNIVREGVTIHRATGENNKTIIGNRCFFMANSHVGHNCVLGCDVMLVNGALLGGFVQVGDRAIIGGNCSVHQFCRVGRIALISNNSGHNVDIPPFFTAMAINHVTQLNAVGLRRAMVPKESINALRQMFRLVYRSRRMMQNAIAELPSEIACVPEVQEFIAFTRGTKRGIARFQAWSNRTGRPLGNDPPVEPPDPTQ